MTFNIPVVYKGKEVTFPAEVKRYGYVHRIQIDIEGQIIFLEKDEEGSYRALADATNKKELDRELLQMIISSVEIMLT